MMIPSIQQFVRKKANEATHRPGKNVLIPKNSRLYPCCNHAACVATHRPKADMPSLGLRNMEDSGRYKGRNTMYHRKYWMPLVEIDIKRGFPTCDVQTLLKATKANVCAIILVARSFFATTRGIRKQEKSSWGRNASDSA